jgi:hypothetical protein
LSVVSVNTVQILFIKTALVFPYFSVILRQLFLALLLQDKTFVILVAFFSFRILYHD